MLPRLSTPDGRRAWALLVTLGGCIVMTLLAVWGLYLLRNQSGFVFWLSLAAHIHILVGMTAIGSIFVRRTIRVDRNGVEISDSGRPIDG